MFAFLAMTLASAVSQNRTREQLALLRRRAIAYYVLSGEPSLLNAFEEGWTSEDDLLVIQLGKVRRLLLNEDTHATGVRMLEGIAGPGVEGLLLYVPPMDTLVLTIQRAKLRELDDFLDEHGMCWSQFFSEIE